MSGATKSTPGEPRTAGGGLSRVRVPMLQRDCSCGGAKTQCDSCNQKAKKKDTLLQRSPAAPSAPAPASAPASVTSTLASPGRPLDAPTRSFMEPRFGRDFSDIRVHADSASAQSAKDVNANAYTVGQHIVFDEGKYDLASHSGKKLLAHELAHTVQQSGLQRSSNDISLDYGADYQRLENEASHAASAVMGGQPAAISGAARPILSRDKKKADADEDPAAAGKVKTAKSKKKVSAKSNMGQHEVTPSETFELNDESIMEFSVKPFYLPGTKGPNAKKEYEGIAGKKLEAQVEVQGSKAGKSALWQKREPTDELRERWLSKVGWTKAAADDLWGNAGGGKEFPKLANNKTCQMDHIVELQLAGDNTDQNIQPLEQGPNQSSGGTIRAEIETLTNSILKDSGLVPGDPKQIKLRFTKVEVVDKVEKLPSKADCGRPKGLTCLGVEQCAPSVKVEKTEKGEVKAARKDYEISAGGGSPRILKVPMKFDSGVDQTAEIAGDTENAAGATIIPGLLLLQVKHKIKNKTSPDVIIAKVDDRAETRLPITLDAKSPDIILDVTAGGVLKLTPQSKSRPNIAFTYKYLSPGAITSLETNSAGGVDWKGHITSSIPFLGELGIEYKDGELTVIKGLDPEKLKQHSVLGMRVTRADLTLKLSPFKPEGNLQLRAGPKDKPIAQVDLKVGTDSVGLTADGKLNLFIPKLKTAEADVSYKGGAGRNEWKADIHIQSEDIKLGPKITVVGGFDGHITSAGIDFTGKITATFPGENTAELGLKKEGDQWILQGKGVFHIKGLDETTVEVEYNLTKDLLYAKGKTGFHLERLKLSGTLDPVEFVIKEGADPKARGKGTLHIERGKVKGDAEVELDWDGKFSGTGSVTYAIKPNLIVTAKIKLSKDQKLKFDGELLLTRYELFKEHGDKKNLFSVGMDVPVPGLSIGSLGGVMFHIGGGVDAEYSFGPGTLEPLKIAASFEPLEENPDINVEVTGEVKVPAKATLSAYIEGSLRLKVDVLVGSAGAEGGIKLQGDLILEGGVFAKFNARYQGGHLSAKVEAGLKTELLLGLSLGIFVHAWAGAFGLSADIRKDWTIAQKKIDTGLGFYMSAPLEYSDDKPFKFPSIDDVTIKKPDLTTENMKRIVGELFSSQSGRVE